MGKIFYSVAGEGREVTRPAFEPSLKNCGTNTKSFCSHPHVAFRVSRRRFSGDSERRSAADSGLAILLSSPSSQLLEIDPPELSFSAKPSRSRELDGTDAARGIPEPDLIIADFEPALPRAARRVGLPILSFDHQHFLTTFDLSSLSWPLWIKAKSIALSIDLFYSGQSETIVSSFFSPPLRPGRRENVTSVGVMLRRELQDVQPSDERPLARLSTAFRSTSIDGSTAPQWTRCDHLWLGRIATRRKSALLYRQ